MNPIVIHRCENQQVAKTRQRARGVQSGVGRPSLRAGCEAVKCICTIFGIALVLASSSCKRQDDSNSSVEKPATTTASPATVEPAPSVSAKEAAQAGPNRAWEFQPGLASLIEQHLQLVRTDTENAVSYATLGLVYEANAMWPEAQIAYCAARELDPDQPMWAYHAANGAQHALDSKGALDILRPAAKRFPHSATIQHRLGDLLLEEGDLEGAAAAFERTVEAAPDRFEGYVGIGHVKVQRGEYSSAVAPLLRALQIKSNCKMAHHLLGTAYRALGRQNDALEHLRLGVNSTRLFMRDPWVAHIGKYRRSLRKMVDQARSMASAGRFNEALGILHKVLEQSPKNLNALRVMGSMYIHFRRPKEAVSYFERAKEADPSNVQNRLELSDSYLAAGRVARALKEATDAVKLAPSDWKTHLNKGKIQVQTGDYSEAYLSLQQARALRPDDPNVYGMLESVCRRLGRVEEARELHEKANALQR